MAFENLEDMNNFLEKLKLENNNKKKAWINQLP